MGCSGSSQRNSGPGGDPPSGSGGAEGDAAPGQAPSERLLDSRKMFYDSHGNIRYGTDSHDRELELHQMFAADDPYLDEPDKVWYVVDASWLASWLAFVHYEKNTSPAPGPCRNDRLIVPDFEAGRFEPRPGLVLSHHGRLTGHYRLMSAAAWSLIEKCYPGSGPEIRTSFHPDASHINDGLYDTSHWSIDQSGYTHVENEAIKGGAIAARPSPRGLVSAQGIWADTIDPPFPSPAADALTAVDGMEDRRITDQDILSLLKFIGAAEGMHTASTMTTGKVPDPHVAAPLSASSTAPGAKHGADPPPTKTANYHSPEVWLFGAAQ